MRLPGTHTGPHALQDFLDNEGFEETARPGISAQNGEGIASGEQLFDYLIVTVNGFQFAQLLNTAL